MSLLIRGSAGADECAGDHSKILPAPQHEGAGWEVTVGTCLYANACISPKGTEGKSEPATTETLSSGILWSPSAKAGGVGLIFSLL